MLHGCEKVIVARPNVPGVSPVVLDLNLTTMSAVRGEPAEMLEFLGRTGTLVLGTRRESFFSDGGERGS